MAVIAVSLTIKDDGTATVKKIEGSLHSLEKTSEKTQSALGKLGGSLQGSLTSGAQSASGSLGALGGALSSVGPVGLAAAASLGVLLTATTGVASVLASSAAAAVKHASAMSDLAARNGLGVESLQKLQFAAAMVGGDVGTMTQAVMRLDKALIQTPDKFQALGLSVANLINLSPEEKLKAVATAIDQIGNDAQRNAAAMDIFGKSAAEVGVVLKGLTSGAGERAQALGIVMDKGMVEALDKVDDAATALGATWDGLWRNMGAAVASSPEILAAIDDITNALGDLSVWVRDNQDVIVPIFDSLGNAIQGAVFVARDLAAAIKSINLSDLLGGSNALGKLAGHVGAGFLGFGAETGPKLSGAASLSGATSGVAGASASQKDLASAAKAAALAQKDLDAALLDSNKSARELEKGMAALEAEILAVALAYEKDFMAEQADAAAGLRAIEQEAKEAADELELLGNLLSRDLLAEQADIEQNAAANAQEAFEQRGLGARFGEEFFGSPGQAFGNFDAIIGMVESLNLELGKTGDMFMRGANAANAFMKAALSGDVAGAIAALGTTVSGFFDALGAGSRGESAAQGASLLGGAGGLMGAQFGAAAGFLFGGKGKGPEKLDPFEGVRSGKGAWDEVNEAVERYGFTVEELGPKMQAQQLDEQAGRLLTDTQLLTASGIEQATVLERMAPAYNEYVQAAIASGTAIPEAMRPSLEKMVEMGLLTDETGGKLSSLDGVSFTETLSEGLSRTIDAINDLVKALTNVAPEADGAANAIKNIPDRTITVTTNYTTSGAPPDGAYPPPDPGSYPPPPPEYAAGGWVPPGEVYRMAEAGRGEWVVPQGQETSYARQWMGAGAGAAPSVTYAPNVTLNLQGGGDPAAIKKAVDDALRNNHSGLLSRIQGIVDKRRAR